MYRLLQGDVGSGKTLVAAEAAIIAIENGYQVAVLAPTEILATQHYFYFKKLFQKLDYVTILLTGSATQREKVQLKKLVAAGLAQVVVGTHALLEADVEFAKLGSGDRRRAAPFRRGTAAGADGKGRAPGRAGDDRHAHSAHARADGLWRPGCVA